jgi:iron(III) transport system ATP-binding protein
MAAPRERIVSASGPVDVRFEEAVKRYGRVEAMSGLDLHIPAGRFVVLLGPSGSGKSTMVRCLAGVERLDGGRLYLGANLVADRRRQLPPERRDVGMVFQDYALWPHLTAAENVAYALRRRRSSTSNAAVRVAEVLERVGLAGHRDRYPHELSGGEQQRVALARAVVARPGLLLFDEPLSNLDADLRERLRVEIATLSRDSGATVVYITHDQSEAFALADEVGVLDHGRLVQLGPPEEIYHRPATRFVARFTGLAAELPGRVVRPCPGEDHVEVEVDGGRLVARRSCRMDPGTPVTVAVRPAATSIGRTHLPAVSVAGVRVGARNGSAPDLGTTAVVSAPTGGLEGTVVDVAYRGRGYDHVVSCAGQILAGCFDAVRHPRGARVRVDLDAGGCVAYLAN